MQASLRRVPALSLGFLTLFCFLLLLKNTALATEAMRRGITLLTSTLIPALFPFAVLSELLRASPLTRPLVARLSRPLCRTLHVGEACGEALLLGLLCGAPVGAQSLMRALDGGECTREECERVLGVSTVPSSAFLIGAVGEGLFSDRRLGVRLLLSVLLAALLTALLLARGRAPSTSARTARASARSLSSVLTDAVRTGAKTMLTVSAFVLFFAVLSDALLLVLSPLPAPLRATVATLLELSEGASRAAALEQKIPAACLTAFAAGWSGLCVHLQILAICDGRGLSYKRYFLCKATEGVLSALLLLLFLSV